MPETETKNVLRSFTCETCGETRNLMAFYDDVHEVWITHDFDVLVDHGEADPDR